MYYIAVNNPLKFNNDDPSLIPTTGLTEVNLLPRFFTGIVYSGNYNDAYKYVNTAVKGGTDTDIVGVWTAPETATVNSIFSFSIPTSKGNYNNNKILSSQFRKICMITPISCDYIAPESVGNTVYCYVQNPKTAQGIFSYQFSFYSDHAITGADMQYNRVFQTMCNGSWSSDALAVYLAQNQSRINFNQSYALQEKNISERQLKNNTALALGNAAQSFVQGAGLMAASVATGGVTSVAGAQLMASGASNAIGSIMNYDVNKEAININYNKIIDGESALQDDYDGMPNIPHSSIGSADWTITNLDYLLPEVAIYSYSSSVLKNVDDYFSRYGYQTNKVKIPNIRGRSKFNYVKTTSAFVRGIVPQYACIAFQNQLNAGYTFWHIGTDLNDSFVGNYTISNPII